MYKVFHDMIVVNPNAVPAANHALINFCTHNNTINGWFLEKILQNHPVFFIKYIPLRVAGSCCFFHKDHEVYC